MLGAAIMIVVLVVAIPVGLMVSGAFGAMIIGWVLRNDVDARHHDSELLDLNG